MQNAHETAYRAVAVALLVSATGAVALQGFLGGAAVSRSRPGSDAPPPDSALAADSVASDFFAMDFSAMDFSAMEGLALPVALPLARAEVLSPKMYEPATLWLARCIYSETKKPTEQRLVAWVVRNRVETHYRGADTYREVVLDPYQFSAFNPGSGKRYFYMSLDATSQAPGWQRALHIAYRVRHMPDLLRPFSITTRHFFSQRSMPGGRFPDWANRRKLVSLENVQIDQQRFRFYKDIS